MAPRFSDCCETLEPSGRASPALRPAPTWTNSALGGRSTPLTRRCATASCARVGADRSSTRRTWPGTTRAYLVSASRPITGALACPWRRRRGPRDGRRRSAAGRRGPSATSFYPPRCSSASSSRSAVLGISAFGGLRVGAGERTWPIEPARLVAPGAASRGHGDGDFSDHRSDRWVEWLKHQSEVQPTWSGIGLDRESRRSWRRSHRTSLHGRGLAGGSRRCPDGTWSRAPHPATEVDDDQEERGLEDVDAGDHEGDDERQRVAEQPARRRRRRPRRPGTRAGRPRIIVADVAPRSPIGPDPRRRDHRRAGRAALRPAEPTEQPTRRPRSRRVRPSRRREAARRTGGVDEQPAARPASQPQRRPGRRSLRRRAHEPGQVGPSRPAVPGSKSPLMSARAPGDDPQEPRVVAVLGLGDDVGPLDRRSPAASTSRRLTRAEKWLKYMSTPSQSASISPGSSSTPSEAMNTPPGPQPASGSARSSAACSSRGTWVSE